MSTPPEPPTDVPDEIAGVRLIERVRTAGPLAVYTGEDALGLRVRVYIALTAALGTSPGAEGFLLGVRDAARAQHSALVPFTTGGHAGDLVYAIAKETPGRSVDELLGRGGALAKERAMSIATTIADVLVTLERAGGRHGDLTPRRILLPGRGQVAIRPPKVLPASLEPRKARYQAPEEARGDAGDIRSDLYVLGLLLVEMLTGQSPVPGSGASAAASLAIGSIPTVADLVPAADAPLRAVLERLLAFEPGKRYGSASEAHAALEAASRGEMPLPPIPVVPAAREVADLIPVAAPLGDDRADTAPIAVDGVRPAQSAAAPGARSPSGTAAGPAPIRDEPTGAPALGGVSATRRGPGRLYVESRLGESLLELDDAVCIGWPENALDVLARPEPFDAAVLRVAPGVDADTLSALGDGVTVNGMPVTTHELAPGEVIEALRVRARYERAARGVLRAVARDVEPTSGAGKARAVTAIAVVGTLAVLAVAFLRIRAIEEHSGSAASADRAERQALVAARDAEASTITGPGKPVSQETAAQAAYQAARAAARRRAGETERARAALRDIARRYPGSAYGALAEIEAAELGARGGIPGAKDVEDLVAVAETDAAEGRLDDGLRKLRAFAEERLDTIEATIARRAIVRLEAEMDARVAADTAKYEAAIAAHDYPLAVRVMDRMLDYVPLAAKDRVLEDKRSVKRRMDAVLGGGGTTSGDAGPPTPPPREPRDPATEPPTPVRPPDGPTAEDGPPESAGPSRDEEAMTAFREARRAMDSGKDRDALSGFVEFLREYKDTPTGAKYDIEVRRRITSLAVGPAGVEELFRGTVERRERGRFRITYDFEDAEQLLDFRDVNAFEAPPRAAWSISAGAARAKGSGAFVLNASFRPDFLSVEVNVQPERAHDLGVIMFEADELRRYYLYTLQNSFFKLGKGDGREDFRENAIVLFGPGMWRDSPPDEIGFVRKCGSEEPKLPPGQAAKIKCGKAEEEVWMRFPGGRTVRGSAYGDQKYEFTGLTPGVFLVNSAGAFDELVIEGVPDPDWLAQRWRDLLNEL